MKLEGRLRANNFFLLGKILRENLEMGKKSKMYGERKYIDLCVTFVNQVI